MTHEAPKLSPITNEATYHERLGYIAEQSQALVQAVLAQALPIDTITIFTQSEEEYAFLDVLLRACGPVSPFTHGSTLYIEAQDLKINGQTITLLGVRRPDPTRPQIGYADYPVSDLDALRNQNSGNEFVISMNSGNGLPLLELRHPDFDILGYVVQVEDHD